MPRIISKVAPAKVPLSDLLQVVGDATAFLDSAESRQQNTDGETFVRCNVCSEWDGHHDSCFIPAMTKWWKEV